MKKIFCIFLSVMLLLLITGCNESKLKYSKDDFDFANDFQYQYSRFHGLSYPITKSDKGYYVLENGFLYFIDKESMKATALCNKPNCLHNDKDECEAFYTSDYTENTSDNLIQYYDGNIYILTPGYDSDNNFDGNILIKISEDGTNREEVFSSKDQVNQWLIHRGYLYYVNGNMQLNDDGTPTTDQFIIKKLPMDDLKEEAEVVYDSKKSYKSIESIDIFSAYDNYLYLQFVMTDDSGEDFNAEEKTLSFNLDSYESNEVANELDDPYINGFVNGKLLVNVVTENDEKEDMFTYYYCDLNGENPEEAITLPLGDDLCCDGKYIYSNNTEDISSSSDEQTCGQIIKVYDEDFNEVDTFEMPFDDVVYILVPQDEDAFIFLDNSKIVYIDKAKIGEYDGSVAKYKMSVKIPKIKNSNAAVTS